MVDFGAIAYIFDFSSLPARNILPLHVLHKSLKIVLSHFVLENCEIVVIQFPSMRAAPQDLIIISVYTAHCALMFK